MPISAELLLDTSSALAFLRPGDVDHDDVRSRISGVKVGLAGHAVFETYSVLTRLPGTLRIDAETARYAIEKNFPHSHFLSDRQMSDAFPLLVEAKVGGGAVYDGLIGLAAKSAGVILLSRDRRAAATYRALGVDFELL